MPIERINRYKKSVPLRYRDARMEERFLRFQRGRGRSTCIFGLMVLALIALCFAFIDYWVLGLKSSFPLMIYLASVAVALAGALFSTLSKNLSALRLRLLLPGGMVLLGLLLSLHYEGYRLYHGFEMGLLLVWLGSLNSLRFHWVVVTVSLLAAAFAGLAWLYGADEFKLPALAALLCSAMVLSLFVAYLLERFRRMLYLCQHTMNHLGARQESWAYTLIDLDMALSGIMELRPLLERLVENIAGVIRYESFALTTLNDNKRSHQPAVMEGALFEEGQAALWNDELISRLTQSRQALATADFDVESGFLGREKKVFRHFRLDIPVFDGSDLVALISLCRADEAYDEMDKTASISLTAQAMMIYKRSLQAAPVKVLKMSESLVKAMTPEQLARIEETDSARQEGNSQSGRADRKPSTEAGITVNSGRARKDNPDRGRVMGAPKVEPDEEVAPSQLVRKLKRESASARKTITLLSRENADRVAVDRYRSAALEGEPLSILLVEVDGLNQLREKNGDKVAYKVFAGIIRHVFSKLDPKVDVLGRYGQNGFSILLYRVDMNAAEKFAESIRYWVEHKRFKTPYGERSVTLSIGVAAITEETGNYESMVKRADMALFVAKKSGRNCVKVRL